MKNIRKSKNRQEEKKEFRSPETAELSIRSSSKRWTATKREATNNFNGPNKFLSISSNAPYACQRKRPCHFLPLPSATKNKTMHRIGTIIVHSIDRIKDRTNVSNYSAPFGKCCSSELRVSALHCRPIICQRNNDRKLHFQQTNERSR